MQVHEMDSVAVCKRLIEAFAGRDPESALAFLDQDVVLEVAFPFRPGEGTMGTRRQSGEAVRAYLREAAARTTSMRFSDGSWDVTSRGLVLFQANGDMILQDGRRYLNHYLFTFRLDYGKIVAWREYYNPVAAARAFGMALEDIPSA